MHLESAACLLLIAAATCAAAWTAEPATVHIVPSGEAVTRDCALCASVVTAATVRCSKTRGNRSTVLQLAAETVEPSCCVPQGVQSWRP